MNAIAQHLPILGAVPPSKEVKAQPDALSNALQSLDTWLCEAARDAALTHGQVCAYIGNGKGGAYDQSQWTKARATGDLPLGRIVAGCPPEFVQAFAARFARAAGLHVSQPDARTRQCIATAAALRVLADTMERTA